MSQTKFTTRQLTLATNPGLEDSTGLRVKLDTTPGLQRGSGGLSVLLDSNPGLQLTSGLKVKRDDDSIQLDASSQLEVRKLRDEASDPGSPAEGEVWMNTTVDTARMRSNVAAENIVGFLWEGLGTLANGDNVGSSSTSETLYTKSSGTTIKYTFPANSMQAGDVYQVFFGARFNTNVNPTTVRIRVRLGGLTGALIWDTGAVSFGIVSNQVCSCMAQFRIMDSTNARSMGLGATGGGSTSVHTLSAMTIDTTTTQDLVATVQFSTNDASNLSFCSQFNVARLGPSPN